jgi:hypothetical protein
MPHIPVGVEPVAVDVELGGVEVELGGVAGELMSVAVGVEDVVEFEPEPPPMMYPPAASNTRIIVPTPVILAQRPSRSDISLA